MTLSKKKCIQQSSEFVIALIVIITTISLYFSQSTIPIDDLSKNRLSIIPRKSNNSHSWYMKIVNNTDKSFDEIEKINERDKIAINSVISKLDINLLPMKRPTLFCYIMSTDKYSDSIKDAMDSWGRYCTEFFVASDVKNPRINAIKIENTRHEWKYLWEKHRETLRYLHKLNLLDKYDFYFKVDDDTYPIMENLFEFLMSDIVTNVTKLNKPIHIGKNNYENSKFMPSYLKEIFKKTGYSWHQVHGGAGNLMNQKFISNIVTILDTVFCLNQEDAFTIYEDSAISLCSQWFGNSHVDTTDKYGKELFHMEDPVEHFYRDGIESISSKTISFHRLRWERARYFNFCYNQKLHQLYLKSNKVEVFDG